MFSKLFANKFLTASTLETESIIKRLLLRLDWTRHRPFWTIGKSVRLKSAYVLLSISTLLIFLLTTNYKMAKFQPPNQNFRYDDKELSLTLFLAEVRDFHQLINILEQGLLKNLRTLRIKGKFSSLATTVLGAQCGDAEWGATECSVVVGAQCLWPWLCVRLGVVVW